MRYLGLDLGTKTLGVSVSDKTALVATFYKNITYSDTDALLDEVSSIVNELDIDKIVLGLPKNMDNTYGERASQTIEFKKLLEAKTNKEVFLEDERLTTKLAQSVLIDADMSRKKRKKVIDGVSAVVILQSYLDRRNQNGRK